MSRRKKALHAFARWSAATSASCWARTCWSACSACPLRWGSRWGSPCSRCRLRWCAARSPVCWSALPWCCWQTALCAACRTTPLSGCPGQNRPLPPIGKPPAALAALARWCWGCCALCLPLCLKPPRSRGITPGLRCWYFWHWTFWCWRFWLRFAPPFCRCKPPPRTSCCAGRAGCWLPPRRAASWQAFSCWRASAG